MQLRELADVLLVHTGKAVSLSTLSRTLDRMQLSRKRVRCGVPVWPSGLAAVAHSCASVRPCSTGTRARSWVNTQLSVVALECNTVLCTAFNMFMRSAYTADQLAFLDETAKDDATLARRYGYGPIGSRAALRGTFLQGKRFTATAAIATTGLIAYDVIPGASNTECLMWFVLHDLVRPEHGSSRASTRPHPCGLLSVPLRAAHAAGAHH